MRAPSIQREENKSIVFPDIKRASPTPAASKIGKYKLIGQQPAYYYSLQFIKSKLGTVSTRIIKEEAKSSKKKCKTIANLSERGGVTDNTSTTDTPKRDEYLRRVSKLFLNRPFNS